MKKKISIISLILIILIFSNATVSNAANSDLWGTAKNWISLGKTEKQNHYSASKWTAFNDMAGIIWGAGVFIIVIIGGVLGIKYMFASVEEKANIKESFLPFIIGTIIIFGAMAIWTICIELFEGI